MAFVYFSCLYLTWYRHDLSKGTASTTPPLKQKQYQSLSAEHMVVIIYSGVTGFLDKIPVNRVTAYEAAVIPYVQANAPEIFDAIKKEGGISPEVDKKIKDVLTEFTETFQSLPVASSPSTSLNPLPAATVGTRVLHPEVKALLDLEMPRRQLWCAKGTERRMPPRGLVGLVNLGNTCFMNAVLKCLLSVAPLVDYFLEGMYEPDLRMDKEGRGQLATAFAGFVRRVMDGKEGTVVSPADFRRQLVRVAPQFSDFSQEDAHEFMSSLIHALHDDLNRVLQPLQYSFCCDDTDTLTPREQASVGTSSYYRNVDIFFGTLQNTLICHKCHRKKLPFERFSSLSLALPPTSTTLNNLLHTFASRETLDEYLCDGCGKRGPASKSLAVYHCPEVLVLHLKRFDFLFGMGKKINTSITFPEELKIDEFLSNVDGADTSATYSLIATTNHTGTLDFGHYTATTRNSDDGTFYLHNDTGVSCCAATLVQNPTSKVYVLFYQKRH
ncbi:Ubiquitin carboxyl-terminal hydrolase 2 [Borealophlyctis nickersoniae]|nr:Ubiquitin carboxyl-terminal hydrolase 2 [Borealophlyctis nickersoniae]